MGPLNYLHIWHDNTGKGTASSWFLKYIIVRDLQTMRKYNFICQRWFAVEKDDGAVSQQSNVVLFLFINERFDAVFLDRTCHSCRQ